MSDDKFSNHSCPECGAPEGLHDMNCSYGDKSLPPHNSSCAGAIVGVICGLVLMTLICVLFNIDIENIPTFFAGLLYIFGISIGIALVQFIISLFG